jgi:GT2 family glycosyltransferase
MKKSVLFVIPTLFRHHELTTNCVTQLRNNIERFGIDFKICVVVNSKNELFEQTDFGPNVEKLCGNLDFSISKALNTAIFANTNFDFFCYVDEGVTINSDFWIDYLLELFEANTQMGLVGCRPHGTPEKYSQPISTDPEMYQVLWSDGILFTTMKNVLQIDGFDEAYFADCELQDFGYRLHNAGYINIFWRGLASHKFIDFLNKSYDPDVIVKHRDNSRKIFYDRWHNFESSTRIYQ